MQRESIVIVHVLQSRTDPIDAAGHHPHHRHHRFQQMKTVRRPQQILTQENHSVLSLSASPRYIFSGSQGSCIHVLVFQIE